MHSFEGFGGAPCEQQNKKQRQRMEEEGQVAVRVLRVSGFGEEEWHLQT